MKTRRLFILVLTVVVVISLASCRNTDKVLGTVALKDQEEATFDVHVPPYVEDGTGWRLRFGMIPWERFNTLKPSDLITVYLENTDDVPVNFLMHLNEPITTIRPKEKTEIFRGELSELIMTGRGSNAEMVFAPMARKITYRLHLVPQVKQGATYTMQFSIFYYSANIL